MVQHSFRSPVLSISAGKGRADPLLSPVPLFLDRISIRSLTKTSFTFLPVLALISKNPIIFLCFFMKFVTSAFPTVMLSFKSALQPTKTIGVCLWQFVSILSSHFGSSLNVFSLVQSYACKDQHSIVKIYVEINNFYFS